MTQIKYYSEHLNRHYPLVFHSTVLESIPNFSSSVAVWKLDCKNLGSSFFLLHLLSWNKEGKEAASGQLNSAGNDQNLPPLVIGWKKYGILLFWGNTKKCILLMKLQE